MGEAKRRKATAPSPLPFEDFIGHHRWTPATGIRLAALCGCDVRLDEVCILGWLITSGAVSASDHAGMTLIIESARPRVRTRSEHWPKLLEAAVLASQDPVFIAAGEPLYDKLRHEVCAG
jgi:hypothetical protein